jgi:hypothetical protein
MTTTVQPSSSIISVCPGSRLYVVKRDNTHAPVKFSKIVKRLSSLALGLDDSLDIAFVTAQVIQGLKPGTTTQELDLLSAKNCGALAFKHPDYSILAARIELSNLSKTANSEFSTFIKRVYKTSVLCETFYENVMKNADQLDLLINHEYDCDMNYLPFKTLESFYLIKDLETGKTIERPQYLLMRVAVAIRGTDLVSI